MVLIRSNSFKWYIMIFNLPVDNDGAFNYIIVVQLMTLNLRYKISLSKFFPTIFLYEKNVFSKEFSR